MESGSRILGDLYFTCVKIAPDDYYEKIMNCQRRIEVCFGLSFECNGILARSSCTMLDIVLIRRTKGIVCATFRVPAI